MNRVARPLAAHLWTRDELLALHERLIGRFGGLAGVRDLGLAESALFRPKSGSYEDVVAMAAALFESIALAVGVSRRAGSSRT